MCSTYSSNKVNGKAAAQIVATEGQGIADLKLSSDGKQLTTLSKKGRVKIWNTKDGKNISSCELSLPNDKAELKLFPDGHHFVNYQAASGLSYDIYTSANCTLSYSLVSSQNSQLIISSDSKNMAIQEPLLKTVFVYDGETGNKINQLDSASAQVEGAPFAFGPDNSKLFIISDDSDLVLWQL